MAQQTIVKSIGMGIMMQYSHIGSPKLESIRFMTEQELFPGNEIYIKGMDGLFEIKSVEDNNFYGLKIGGTAYNAIPVDINKKPE